MKKIYITSFKRSLEFPDRRKFSVAVWQPSSCNYPKLDWADIRDKSGKWIMPRDFIQFEKPLEHYTEALWQHYQNRSPDIYAWSRVAKDGDILCCWCPYEKAAQRQLKEFGSFVCHTSVIALYLKGMLGRSLNVILDEDRMKQMWKPNFQMVSR